MVTQNLSVRDTEALVKKYQEGLKPKTGKPVHRQNHLKLHQNKRKHFADFFGTKVDVNVAANGKGKISIPFHSEEDFNRIMKLINN